jgi:hypothetical protein
MEERYICLKIACFFSGGKYFEQVDLGKATQHSKKSKIKPKRYLSENQIIFLSLHGINITYNKKICYLVCDCCSSRLNKLINLNKPFQQEIALKKTGVTIIQ